MSLQANHDAYLNLARVAETGDPSKLMKAYDEVAAVYDAVADLTKAKYPEVTAKAIDDLKLPKTCSILDVCGGTGNVAKKLVPLGYKNLTYLDGSIGMTIKASELDLYHTMVKSIIPEDIPTILAADSFDVVVMCAGHVSKGKIIEMIRLTKPGGYTIVVTTEHAQQYQDEWQETERDIKDAVKSTNTTLAKIEMYENSCIEEDGLPRPGHVIVINK